MLSPKLLAVLRAWWKVERPRHWLFPGERPETPITVDGAPLDCGRRWRSGTPRRRDRRGATAGQDRPSSRWRSCWQQLMRRRPSGSTSRSRGASSRRSRRTDGRWTPATSSAGSKSAAAWDGQRRAPGGGRKLCAPAAWGRNASARRLYVHPVVRPLFVLPLVSFLSSFGGPAPGGLPRPAASAAGRLATPPAASAGPQVGSRSTSSMPGAVGRCRSMRIRGRETEGRGRRRDRPSSRWRSCCRRPTRRRPSGSTSRSRGASSRGRRRPAVPRRRPRSQGQGRGGRRPRPEDAAARPPLRTARRRSGVSRPLGAALGRYPASTARPSARSPPCSPRSTRRSDRCRSSRSATTSTAAAPCISTAASRSRRPTTEDAPGHGRNSTFRRARRGSSR